MTAINSHNLADNLAASIEWWRTAGVTYDFADNATEWLSAQTSATQEAEVQNAATGSQSNGTVPGKPAVKKIGGAPESWPQTLEAFAKWWCEADAIDDGGMYPRIPPQGSANPELMILVTEPEARDQKELLSGPEGALLSRFLFAAGIDADSVYVASALPRHTPLPDWDELRAAGLGAILAHHIDLVAPKRILAFGRNIPPLLSHKPTQAAANLSEINQNNGNIPVLVSKSLAALLRSPAMRKAFWHQWLEAMEG